MSTKNTFISSTYVFGLRQARQPLLIKHLFSLYALCSANLKFCINQKYLFYHCYISLFWATNNTGHKTSSWKQYTIFVGKDLWVVGNWCMDTSKLGEIIRVIIFEHRHSEFCWPSNNLILCFQHAIHSWNHLIRINISVPVCTQTVKYFFYSNLFWLYGQYIYQSTTCFQIRCFVWIWGLYELKYQLNCQVRCFRASFVRLSRNFFSFWNE